MNHLTNGNNKEGGGVEIRTASIICNAFCALRDNYREFKLNLNKFN